jgi:hypothetical protein
MREAVAGLETQHTVQPLVQEVLEVVGLETLQQLALLEVPTQEVVEVEVDLMGLTKLVGQVVLDCLFFPFLLPITQAQLQVHLQ